MNNLDETMKYIQLALDVAMEQLMSAQKAAAMVNQAQMEERDMTDAEMDQAQSDRQAAVDRFRQAAGV